MFAISRQTVDAARVAAAVRSDKCGAVVTFLGIVRARSDDGRQVTGLSYEAHEAAATAQFEEIATEARVHFGTCEIAIVHRVGDLAIGEVAVVVAAAAPHRAAAFDACEFAIDQLKQRASIWKKEAYADGTAEWKENNCSEAPS